MPQFSDNQRALIQMGSMFLLYIAAAPTSIVPDGSPYATAMRTGLGLAAIAGMGLQKLLQATPEEQSAVMDLVQRFLTMTPEKQQELLAYLPKMLPLLQAMSVTPPPAQPQPLP